MLPVPIKILLIISDIILIVALACQQEDTGPIHDLTLALTIFVSILCILDGLIGLVI